MASSTLRRIREIRALIEAQGGTIQSSETHKHVKIKFTNPQGVPKMLVMSASPSDRRVDMKIRQDLRRLMQI